MVTNTTTVETMGLKRTLRFRDLVIYGIILTWPTTPMLFFSILHQETNG